jgi:hypothetical protein
VRVGLGPAEQVAGLAGVHFLLCTRSKEDEGNVDNTEALAYTTDLQHIAVTDPEHQGFDLRLRA